MAKERLIRSKSIVGIGEIIDLLPPWPDEGGRWVVVGVETDPDAVWNLTYDGEEPDATPETVLLRLKAVR